MIKNDYEPTNLEIEEAERQSEEDERLEEEYDAYIRERMSEDEEYNHWKEKIPHLIFKYRSVDNALSLIRSIDIIKNHRLFMSPSKLLNDPFEGGNVDYLLSEDSDEFNKLIKECRILSLSRDCFSAPLWAHYTSECKGICIGFSTYKSFSCIRKLEYASTIDKKQWWTTDKKDAVDKEFYYKSKEWEYEDEYRIVRNHNQKNLIHETDYKGNDKVFFPFDEAEIAVVIFGENVEKEIKDAIVDIIPSTCLAFDIKADKKRSRYYLVKCTTDETPIYTLEELYKIVLNK